MRHAATTWTFASAGNRLAELMKLFGCADLIAPWDTEAFGNRMGELVRRGVSAPKKALLEVKARLEAEFAAETERSGAASRSPIKVTGAGDFQMPIPLQYPLERSRVLQEKWLRLLDKGPPRDRDHVDDDDDDEEVEEAEVDRKQAVIREPDKDE